MPSLLGRGTARLAVACGCDGDANTVCCTLCGVRLAVRPADRGVDQGAGAHAPRAAGLAAARRCWSCRLNAAAADGSAAWGDDGRALSGGEPVAQDGVADRVVADGRDVLGPGAGADGT